MKQESFDKKLVSIITPAFNSSSFIADAIHSAQAQLYPHWEQIIVVDQGTTDNTAEIVQSFADKDPRVRLIVIKDKRGISLARNTAIENARGKYIAFLDSDDMWLPEKLSEHLEFMIERKAAFSCTGYRRLSENGQQVGEYIGVKEIIDYDYTLKNNTVGCPTIIIDREQTGPFQMIEGRAEDYVLVLEILKRGFVCHGLNKDLSRYRYVHNARSRKIFTSFLSRWDIYRQREGFSLMKSLWISFWFVYFAVKKRLVF